MYRTDLYYCGRTRRVSYESTGVSYGSSVFLVLSKYGRLLTGYRVCGTVGVAESLLGSYFRVRTCVYLKISKKFCDVMLEKTL